MPRETWFRTETDPCTVRCVQTGGLVAACTLPPDAVLIEAAPLMLELLRAATAYVELSMSSGVLEQPPEWARLPNGDYDGTEIGKRARALLNGLRSQLGTLDLAAVGEEQPS